MNSTFSLFSSSVSRCRWTFPLVAFLFAKASYCQLPPDSPCCGGQFYDGGIMYEVDTHAALTEASLANDQCQIQAFLKNELLMQSGLLTVVSSAGETHSLLNWAKEGSKREDDDERYWNHFHDPILDLGLIIPFIAEGEDAVTWAISSPNNDWDLAAASIYFRLMLTSQTPADRDYYAGKTFRAVGHFMHIIQDLAQPWHTRDDPHPNPPVFLGIGADGWIEYYAHEHYGTAVGLDDLDGVDFDAAAAEPPWFTLYDWLPGHTVYRHFLDTDQYTGQIAFAGFGQPPNIGLHPGISEYSNYNFFSDDTIFQFYPHPAKVADTDYENVFPLSGTITYTSTLTSPPQYSHVRKDEPASLGIETGFILCAGRDIDASLAQSSHFPSSPRSAPNSTWSGQR